MQDEYLLYPILQCELSNTADEVTYFPVFASDIDIEEKMQESERENNNDSNVTEELIKKQNLRISKLRVKTEEDLHTITKEDFEALAPELCIIKEKKAVNVVASVSTDSTLLRKSLGLKTIESATGHTAEALKGEVDNSGEERRETIIELTDAIKKNLNKEKDVAVIEYLMNKENPTIAEIMSILNNKSRVLGMSGISSDFRDLENAEKVVSSNINLATDIGTEKEKGIVLDDEKSNAAQGNSQLVYYRLKIKSFNGNLTTLDKDIVRINKYMFRKKELIETAKKNCEAVYSENVSMKEIDEQKRMLEAIGFVTEIEQISNEWNAVIEYLYKYGVLLLCYGGVISEKIDFDRMNKIDAAIGNETIRNIESFEVHNAIAKKTKYTKSGIIKIPFLGGDRTVIAFTDTRIFISKRNGTIQRIDKTEISSVKSVFEKQALSFKCGQIQVTMKTGDVFVIVLEHKDYSAKKRDEFDNRVSFLEAIIKQR